MRILTIGEDDKVLAYAILHRATGLKKYFYKDLV